MIYPSLRPLNRISVPSRVLGDADRSARSERVSSCEADRTVLIKKETFEALSDEMKSWLTETDCQ